MDSTSNSTRAQLNAQFSNPNDILSLLLLIGGDTVQRAIAQLFGFYIQPFKKGPKLYLTPVAFSFGWVGYAFTSLASVIGDKQLMPSQPDSPSKIINCDTSYTRINRSWLLGRLLRDHELEIEKNCGPECELMKANGIYLSLRIDIFDTEDSSRPEIDWIWVFGWFTIVAQLGLSISPWIKWGDWGIFLVTASGTAFALITGSLRQWNAEKWAGRRLNNKKGKTKTVCLTRGNGHKNVMILSGTGTAWDLESLATATSDSMPDTPWLLGGLAFLWTCLLITVSGLKQNTWFLIGIGIIGMIQNIVAGNAKRPPGTLKIKLIPNKQRPYIVAPGLDWPKDDDNPNSDEDFADNVHWRQPLNYHLVQGVRGAIRELEKLYPKAGVALMQEFFPAIVKYEPQRYRTNAEKKFWKSAFREFGQPVVKP
ncbi:MAG: hypothetical protein Q9167_007776 [Letrouitia subvulpina]